MKPPLPDKHTYLLEAYGDFNPGTPDHMIAVIQNPNNKIHTEQEWGEGEPKHKLVLKKKPL